MAAITTATTDATTGVRETVPGRRRRGGGHRRCPTSSCSRPLSCWERCSATRSSGSSPCRCRSTGCRRCSGSRPPWVGLDNFRTILEDAYFWTVLWRTLIFCFVNVALTMVLGVLVALLLDALGRGMRLFVSASLIVAWAMPALTATIVWQWMFDTEYGLVNWALGRQGESWWANQLTFFMVATIIVVWMGIPFVAFTVYAALTQIPVDIVEAAKLDGAGFRDTLPLRRLPGAEADPADPDRRCR